MRSRGHYTLPCEYVLTENFRPDALEAELLIRPASLTTSRSVPVGASLIVYTIRLFFSKTHLTPSMVSRSACGPGPTRRGLRQFAIFASARNPTSLRAPKRLTGFRIA